MVRQMGNRIRKGRFVLAAISGWAFTYLAVGGIEAWAESAHQDWGVTGHGWLGLDFWSRVEPWKAAACGGILALFLGWAGGKMDGNPGPMLRWGVSFFGRPWVLGLLLLTAHRLPSTVANLTQPQPPPGAPNIVVVVVDSLRADHCGFMGYSRPTTPGLDALAEKGVVFENALSSSGWTKPAVGTLFTGLIPSNHGAVSRMSVISGRHGAALNPPALTLPEILRNRGWRTGVFSNNPNVLHKYGFTQGVEHFSNYWEVLGYEAGRAESMTRDVLEWVGGLKEEEPFFAYLHLMDTHYPYFAPAPFAGTWDQSGLDLNVNGNLVERQILGEVEISDAQLARIVDLYDESILYSDAHLAPFIAGLLDSHPNTVVVLVADHGEEFLEHGHLGHGHSLFQELVHIPLVIWAPDLQPGRVNAQVRLMDIPPSLLEWAAAPIPASMQGKALQPLTRGEESGPRPAPMETGGDQQPQWHWRALSDGVWKWIAREADLPHSGPEMILSEREMAGPYSLLFNLDSDAEEGIDLLPSESGHALRLKDLMADSDWYFPPSHVLTLAIRSRDSISEEEAARLAALGYAGDDKEEADG